MSGFKINTPKKNCFDELYSGFDLTRRDGYFFFNSYVSKDKDKVVVVIPRSQIIENRIVSMVLDGNHVIRLDSNRLSVNRDNTDDNCAVLLRAADFEDSIVCISDTDNDDTAEDKTEFSYWLKLAEKDNKFRIRPKVTEEGILWL